MIAALAEYPMPPEKEKLRILLLPTATTYEWGAVQSIVVLDKLLSAFYATNNESDQIDTEAVMEVIRLYLMDLDGSCEFAEFSHDFDHLFFWHLVRKLPPSDDKCDREMRFIETTSKKCVDKSNSIAQAYATLALWCGSLDADLLAAALAKSPNLFSCVMVDCIESDAQCALAVAIFRKLVRLNVIQLDSEGIIRMLDTWSKVLEIQYSYEKLKRTLAFIEELVLSGLDVDNLMRTIDGLKCCGVRIYFIVAHFIGDMMLFNGKTSHFWLLSRIREVYCLNYGLKPVYRGTSVPFEAPSSLQEICRYRIHKMLRKKMSLADYFRFVTSLDCSEFLKAYLKLWPTEEMAEKVLSKIPDWAEGEMYRLEGEKLRIAQQ
jgi:hypothetical protein